MYFQIHHYHQLYTFPKDRTLLLYLYEHYTREYIIKPMDDINNGHS